MFEPEPATVSKPPRKPSDAGPVRGDPPAGTLGSGLDSSAGEDQPLIKVSALREGTVIDHLAQGTALKVLEILGLEEAEGTVTIGLNLESGKMSRKDIIKVEHREVTPQDVAKISLVAPHATFSIIRNFRVVDKFEPALPELIENLIRCPNPSCVTSDTRVATKFRVHRPDPLQLRCHYCERTIKKDEIELL